MQNRRVMPGLFFKDRVVRTPSADENAKVDAAVAKRKKFDEGKAKAQGAYKEKLKEGAMKRSYTIDEMTTATMLKGHPDAQAIIDMLNKGKKKNESGEEFQDGSEDSIGAEGHAAVARPDSIKHEGKPSGIGPNEPGTATEKESQQKSEGDSDLEKSDNLTDNLPEEFEDGMVGAEGEDDDGDVLVEKKKSMTADEETLNHLLKTMGPERLEEVIKAASSKYTTPGALASKTSGGYQGVKLMNEIDKHKSGQPSELDAKRPEKSASSAEKSEGDIDLEKSEDENVSEYSLEFSKSILEGLGLLEKGATSVSKEAGGGKATQINYGTKPTTKFKHPKAKADKKYIHNPEKGTVKVEKEGEKTREIGVSEESKLKNASISSADLYKSLDAILAKKAD